MRKQLSQPSFVNGFARSKGESVRPDLWPDRAYVPNVYGGGSAYDLCSMNHGEIGANIGRLVNAYDFYNSNGGVISSNFNCANEYGFTIVSKIKTAGAYNTIYGIGVNTTSDLQAKLKITNGASGTIEYANYNGSWHTVSTTASSLPAGSTYTIIIAYNRTNLDIYLDGSLVKSSSFSSSYMPATTKSLYLGRYEGGEATAHQGYGYLLYYRPLQPTQIAYLSIDPLLPFRRKTFVSFYVPSASPTFKPYYYRNQNILLGAG